MSGARTPARLSTAGKHLWRATVDEHELRPDELLLLEKACRTADDLGRLEVAMAREPLTTTGSTGQVRAHPLLAEIRGMRQLLAALLKQLAVPDNEADSAVSSTTSRARAAARARWGQRGA